MLGQLTAAAPQKHVAGFATWQDLLPGRINTAINQTGR
jgi:hypothetical protein